MDAEFIGKLSGALVCLSAVPYFIRTWQWKIEPQLTSWSLWSLIGLALWLTYVSSGAKENAWPAFWGFINPLIITILILRHHRRWVWPKGIAEWACLVCGVISLGLWWLVRDSQQLSQYALYLAIIADGCAAIPTIKALWKYPQLDRPFAWGLFAIGYGLALLAIPQHTFANYALPVYMCLGSLSITLPLVIYRVRQGIPLREWV